MEAAGAAAAAAAAALVLTAASPCFAVSGGGGLGTPQSWMDFSNQDLRKSKVGSRSRRLAEGQHGQALWGWPPAGQASAAPCRHSSSSPPPSPPCPPPTCHQVQFVKADIRGSDFSGSNMEGVTLFGALAVDAKFVGTNLR